MSELTPAEPVANAALMQLISPECDSQTAIKILECDSGNLAKMAVRLLGYSWKLDIDPTLPVDSWRPHLDRSLTTISLLSCPAVVLHGTHDRIFPTEHGEDLAARIAGAVHVSLEGAGMLTEIWWRFFPDLFASTCIGPRELV